MEGQFSIIVTLMENIEDKECNINLMIHIILRFKKLGNKISK